MNPETFKITLLLVFLNVPLFLIGQTTDKGHSMEDVQVEFKGFLDIFYAYDFNKPQTNYRQPFHYNFNRHNEFNVNLGLIQASLIHETYRANLGLQTGTYAVDNYAQEDPVFRHVFEANIGIALNKRNNLWIDAGIFASHLGFESAISIENWTLTRSLAAENSPYFLTGGKVTYDPNDRWTFGVIVANGWQRIQRLPGNSLPAIGTQINYQEGDLTLNWSTLIGTDDPDTTRRVRIFNNLYGIMSFSEKLRMIAGFDIGMQKSARESSNYQVWLTPTLIFQYDLIEDWSVGIRAEYFKDEHETIIITNKPDGFATTGFSVNLDYNPAPPVACRIEGRWLKSGRDLYAKNDNYVQGNLVIVGSIAVIWSK